MANAIFGWPIWSDVGVLYTPTLNSGMWPSTLPLTNLQDRRLHRVARSLTAYLPDTRLRCDLKTDRSVRMVTIPKHSLSSSAKWRVLGVPSTMLFDYEAGDDIAALSGTFSRAPTATVRAATYVDVAGRIQFAGENRCLRSEAFDNASWTKSNVTVAADAVAAPDGTTTADTLTATSANGTVLQSVTETAVSWTFSVWLKRKTGSGNIQIQLDGSTYVTKAVTTEWQRFSVTQTGGAGATSLGIKIVTSGDAVWAWGAQAEIGSSALSYLPTTSAMVGAPRDGHYSTIGGARELLHEAGRTNLCLQSENFGTTWAAVGTPTRSAAAAVCGVVSLDLIGDDDGGALEGYTQTVTFTGDAVKAVSCLIRQGTSTSTVIRLRDTSAGADRLLAAVTWSGGLPVVTMTTGTGLGYQTLVDASSSSVFQLWFATSAVTAANTNSLQVYPATNAALATASTGNVYAGGVQAENALGPSSYIPTTTATVARATDSLVFPFAAPPQALTVYAKITERGATLTAGQGLWVIGTGPATAEYLDCYNAGSGRYAVESGTAAGTVSSESAPPGAVLGDTVECRSVLASNGAVTEGQSINGAAETVATTSAANTLDGTFSAATITIGSRGTNSEGITGFRSVRVVAGVQTMATVQAVVSDSGWLDAWPSGIDAEESEGMNLPLVKTLSSAFTARYWSVQISDTSNSDGYVDLARLVVAAGYQPTVNLSNGAQLGVVDLSRIAETDGGSEDVDERSTYRTLACVFENVTESEGMVNLHDFLRIAGTKRQFYFVFDPNDTTHMHRRSFLARLERLSPLALPFISQGAMAFNIKEQL